MHTSSWTHQTIDFSVQVCSDEQKSARCFRDRGFQAIRRLHTETWPQICDVSHQHGRAAGLTGPWVSASCLPIDQQWHKGTENSCTQYLSYILSPWRCMSLNVKWKCEGSYMFTLMWIWNILKCNYRRQDVTSMCAQYQHRFVWRWFEVHRILDFQGQSDRAGICSR